MVPSNRPALVMGMLLDRHFLARLYLCRDRRPVFLLRHSQVVGGLQIDPQAGGGAKVTGQPQRGVGGDRTLAREYITQAGLRDMQGLGEGVGREPQRREVVLTQDDTWVDGYAA